MRGPCTATKSNHHLSQLEKSPHSNEDPAQPNNKSIKLFFKNHLSFKASFSKSFTGISLLVIPKFLEKTLTLGKIEGRKRSMSMRWMASLTQWTWVWADSRSWWWTGKPGMLQSMEPQRVRQDLTTEQQVLAPHFLRLSPSGSVQKHSFAGLKGTRASQLCKPHSSILWTQHHHFCQVR